MPRQTKSISDAVQLIQTADLITKAAQTVISEWSKEAEALHSQDLANGTSGNGHNSSLQSHALYDAQRIILAATGKLTELVSDPSIRILYIAAERRVADILAAAGDEKGKHVSEISKEAKIESRKLCTSLALWKLIRS